MNLAPWRYRSVTRDFGGPIDRITISKIENYFEAYSYLREEFRNFEWTSKFYGTCDGCGTANSVSVARYKAISESLERCAFYSLRESDKINDQLGFAREPTSSGIAAYPGFFKSRAREIARLEAIERWAICSWWSGCTGARKSSDGNLSNYEIIEIIVPWDDVSVVVLAKPTSTGFVYGFAAANRFAAAVEKALIELSRNERVLTIENLSLINAGSTQDRRLAYFASNDGKREFDLRTRSRGKSAEKPRLVVDCELVGHWSKYATVWRVLFDMPNREHISARADVFFF